MKIVELEKLMVRATSFSRLAPLAAAAAALAVSACAVTPTPYQPASAGSRANAYGYSDQQIEPDRFRVSFAGNSYTERETVERYLLYRAAQLTVERGYDHFILADRDTDKKTRTYVNQPFGGFSSFGYWSPYWRYYGAGYGWRGWDPFFGGPFFDRTVDVRTVERYEALAEIVLGRGPKPQNVRAFDARAVLQSLGPSVVAPAQ